MVQLPVAHRNYNIFILCFHSVAKNTIKGKGFFYGVIYTAFDAIKNMRLSEDGVLVVETDRRRLLLHFRNVEDLERIYKFFMEH
ncbi:DUF986 family protein [Tuberibacillus calidus]|uniref:DUF986 family protein n=1 Tax=Tuberibacillus calidus TaxID=340097 RepID=UPI000406BB1B|nr:DUF986 family protein [Tuberibacillus calidus]